MDASPTDPWYVDPAGVDPHIHYEIRHADLPSPYRGEVYSGGDPSC